MKKFKFSLEFMNDGMKVKQKDKWGENIWSQLIICTLISFTLLFCVSKYS